jgi:hypothetical protein
MSASALTQVIDAMREVQTESDRWRLAEALHAVLPTGSTGFERIEDEAAKRGVAALSATTLRLYRDTAARWPKGKRVDRLSFSSHREAMVLPTIDDAREMLVALSDQLGPSKVTVSAVRRAIAAQTGNGKVPAAAPGANVTGRRVVQLDALHDLKNGGPQLIAAITNETPADDLDRLQAGLSKVLAHVERHRARVAKSAAKAKAKTTTTTTTKTKTDNATGAKPAARRAKAGDLRGL